jgi:hypothetical protein
MELTLPQPTAAVRRRRSFPEDLASSSKAYENGRGSITVEFRCEGVKR